MKLFKKFTNIYFWFDLVNTIKVFFKPRQRWLTKTIPKDWKDKPELIRDILFECVVHYIEEEKPNLDYDWSKELKSGFVSQDYVDKQNKWNADILKCYDYIQNIRPRLEKEIDDSYPVTRPFDEMFEKIDDSDGYKMKTTEEESRAYNKVRRLEDRLYKKDQQVLNLIVKHRIQLWT